MSADSALANLTLDQLEVSVPENTTLRLPAPPAEARGSVVRTIFLVTAAGTVDTSTVIVQGSADSRYRREMAALLFTTRFLPPVVDGCPVRGRGDISITGIPAGVRRF